MKLRAIPYSLDFQEHNRGDLVFSDDTKLRLDPADRSLKLKADSDGKFPTDADLWVKTQQFYPTKAKEWRGFHAVDTVPTGTSIKYRLSDGTTDYYWDGAQWSAAGASDWNTEGEIATNINTFPVPKIRVVINLQTTDDTLTPEISEIQLAYGARVVFLDEYINRTIVPLLRDNVRPIARWPLPIGTTTSTIDLDDYTLDAPFNITDVESVYNHTDDPNHLTDLFDSYDPGTKVITLTTSIDAGKVAWVWFEYEPEVAALTSVDYHELGKAPALTIEDLRCGWSMRSGWNNEVKDREAGTALVYEPPWQIELLGDIVIHAPRSHDEMSLLEEVVAYISDNQTVKAPGLDQYVDWFVTDPYTRSDVTSLNDIRTARLSFRMRPLYLWLRAQKSGYLVQNLRLTGDMDVVI